MIRLVDLLNFSVTQDASDVHISVGAPPNLRIYGEMVKLKGPPLSKEDTRRLCYSVLNDKQKSKFEETRELDFSFEVKNLARFRANYFFQKGNVSAVYRRIPAQIPTINQLGLPKAISDLTNLKNGLVLVTGPTGNGKTTTIAALLNKINREKHGHIITIEDPIEYVHSHLNCVVNQREVGYDTQSYKGALRQLLRQDPDFCLMGELRDLESVETALSMAETGHLVFATLHTNSAAMTINRIVSIFSADHQDRIRNALSFNLQAVVSQRLVPREAGGRIAAFEFLLMSQNIRNLVRENKLQQVEGMMQVGQDGSGMVTMEQYLYKLVKDRKISLKTAYEYSPHIERLENLLKRKES